MPSTLWRSAILRGHCTGVTQRPSLATRTWCWWWWWWWWWGLISFSRWSYRSRGEASGRRNDLHPAMATDGPFAVCWRPFHRFPGLAALPRDAVCRVPLPQYPRRITTRHGVLSVRANVDDVRATHAPPWLHLASQWRHLQVESYRRPVVPPVVPQTSSYVRSSRFLCRAPDAGLVATLCQNERNLLDGIFCPFTRR